MAMFMVKNYLFGNNLSIKIREQNPFCPARRLRGVGLGQGVRPCRKGFQRGEGVIGDNYHPPSDVVK
ncbi:MAG: hypothetical protein HUN04_06150 [Desulfobacter sp.]|nr:MAG: hypothetical protein HUN04_06150 [Desulfobacter sp.]